jgi:hypothetical protein
MQLLINGYGRGAFANLRCSGVASSDTVLLRPAAMFDLHGREWPALVIKARTGKLNRVSSNNAVDIVLHSMTSSEATILARRLMEFARLQDGAAVAAG